MNIHPEAHIPFRFSEGPRDARIAIVGETWGEAEERLGLPFQGGAGAELNSWLERVGIARADCFITNVFPFRPPGNKLERLCVSRKELAADYPHPALYPRLFVPDALLSLAFPRLSIELDTVRPNLIIALGNPALWALTGRTGISKLRGTIMQAAIQHLSPTPLKLLPTYHPAFIMRSYKLRPIALADMTLAASESAFPEIRTPLRHALIPETPWDIEAWFLGEYTDATIRGSVLSCDVETHAGQILCIGFAAAPDSALCIPFTDRKGKSYWSPQDEAIVLRKLKYWLECGDISLLFQNGMYDLAYLLSYDIHPRAPEIHDTMLAHWALYPELPKDLGTLGSLYASLPAWKSMRRAGSDKLKTED